MATPPILTTSSASAAQLEDAPLKVLWENEMKTVNKYVHHKHVVVLLLFWEYKPGWCDMNAEQEVDRLAAVFKTIYKFEIRKEKFTEGDSPVQNQMNWYLSKFVRDFDGRDDTLLIVYYAGHGWALPGGRGKLNLTGSTGKAESDMPEWQKEHRSIHWNDSERNIRKTKSDMLLILDCCDSGTLGYQERSRGRNFEVPAACEHNKTTMFPGDLSFTSALIWALENLANELHFSTCALRQKIKMEAPLFSEKRKDQNPQLYPRYPVSNRYTTEEHIMIEILGRERSEEALGISREDEIQLGDHADIRLYFTTSFDKFQLQAVAKEMKNIIRQSDLPLRRIGFLNKGNVVNQAVQAWRNHKKSSRAPVSPLTPTTSNALPAISPSHLESGHGLSPAGPSIIVSPTQPDIHDRVEEGTPLLPGNNEYQNRHDRPSGVRYHFQELCKCIWSQCFGWLWTVGPTVGS